MSDKPAKPGSPADRHQKNRSLAMRGAIKRRKQRKVSSPAHLGLVQAEAAVADGQVAGAGRRALLAEGEAEEEVVAEVQNSTWKTFNVFLQSVGHSTSSCRRLQVFQIMRTQSFKP